MAGSSPAEKVLGCPDLLRHILICLGASGDLVRATAVSTSWCASAKLPSFLDEFRKRFAPPLLGYVVEFDSLGWQNSKFVACPGVGGAIAQEACLLAAAFRSPKRNFLVLHSINSRLVGRERSPAPGYIDLKLAAGGVQTSVITTPEQAITPATENTWGHFAVLNGEISFFVAGPAGNAMFAFGGVQMQSDDPVHYHVNVFKDGGWELKVSEGMTCEGGATFFRAPYSVIQHNVLYMMYEVGIVKAYDMHAESFSAVDLPIDFAYNKLHAGWDYRVCSSTVGMLTMVQVQGALLRIWDLLPSGTWNLRASLPFPLLFGLTEDSAMWCEDAYRRTNTRHTYLVRMLGADEGARHLVARFGRAGSLYSIDTERKEATEILRHANTTLACRVLPVTLSWPPKLPASIVEY